MNQRKNKKQAKLLEAKSLKAKSFSISPSYKVKKELPTHGSVVVGGQKVVIPYIDQIEGLTSSESAKLPIKVHIRKGTKILSTILRKSGIDTLVDIGDAMVHRY